ncbi:MAG: SpoIID/LytB domain-containing protein [Lachnospiraceae bacterium]|nr:SpoIID/LytB domain-containing protein [Lachnospiraceae bacterium]
MKHFLRHHVQRKRIGFFSVACKIFYGLAFILLIPVVFTFLIQGGGKNAKGNIEFLNTTEIETGELDESILPGILANQISMDTETEAMKAQAVIVRTNCLRALERGEEMPEGLTKGEMLRIWGQDSFSEYYSQLESCVEATKGVAMMQDGTYIQADFHKVSAGYTRNAAEVYGNTDYPYLKSADSRMDIPAPDFLKVIFYTPEEFVQKGNTYFSAETAQKSAADILAGIEITKRDKAGYVLEVSIDGKQYSGEELRLAYDWNSAAFSIKEVDGQIRVVTKGFGHGLGLSLYGAEALAKEGYTYKEILEYFYHEIAFITIE